MPDYDTGFNPPAPVADVTINHPVTGAEGGARRGKLDTGADVTVIPEQLVAQLNLTPKGLIWTRSYDGAYSQRPVITFGLLLKAFLSRRCVALRLPVEMC